jgi:hypothetical protein
LIDPNKRAALAGLLGRWTVSISAQQEASNAVRVARGERGISQRRFWEHLLHDEADFARHIEYCYISPLKHRPATRVRDWPSIPHFIATSARDCFRKIGAATSKRWVSSANDDDRVATRAEPLCRLAVRKWRITLRSNPPLSCDRDASS